MRQTRLTEVKRAHQLLADLTVARESPDGLVTVAAGAFGELRDLCLDPRIGRDRNAGALAAKILRTHRAAAEAAADAAADAAEVLLPGCAGGADVDLAFDPILRELDDLGAVPQHSRADGRPVLAVDCRELRDCMRNLRDEAKEIRESAQSGDGLVSVTVGGHGELVALALDRRVYRTGNADRLATCVLDTSHQAVTQVGQRLTDLAKARWTR